VTQILVAAATAYQRQKLTAAVQGVDRPVVAPASRGDIAVLRDANERQVLVYWADYECDVGWVSETLEQHPGLIVVYLSPNPVGRPILRAWTVHDRAILRRHLERKFAEPLGF
jgi:hypothetical protein